MIRIAGDDHVAAVFCRAFGQMLHPGNKRTGGIDNFCRAAFQVSLHLRRYTVGANHCDSVAICFVRLINSRNT